MIVFTVPGRLGGKGRPRFAVVQGRARAFTPKKTASDEAIVRQFASEAMEGRAILDGALALNIAIYLNPPASWSKKKREAADWVTGKPDPDNSVKLIADAMNSIVYRDDSQIATISFKRHYTLFGKERIEVSVSALSPVLSSALLARTA